VSGGDRTWRDAELPTDERVVRACLLRAVEPGTRAVIDLVAQLGAPEALAAIVQGRPVGDCDVEGMRTRITPGSGERDLAAAAEIGARLVIPSDPEWPAALDDLGRLGLTSFGVYVRGAGPLPILERSISVVGTRVATDYGTWVAAELSGGMAERGWAVVSGLAFGIDAAAHRGALATAPPGAAAADSGAAVTVAVLACGIDAVYPKAHRGLLRRILEAGTVITEQPPGAAPHRIRFLVRNRLIAALSGGTLVVEAAARSGARTTARYAGALGRPVMAVPGPITATTSVGCHQLLRDDPAVGLVTCVDDIIEMAGSIGDLAPRPQGVVTDRDSLPALHRKVLDAVPVQAARPVERIALTAGVSPHRTAATLAQLALGDYVEQVGPGWRLSIAQRDRRRASGQEALDLDWW